MLPNLHQLLLDNRLQQQGVNTDEAPALFRNLAKILESGSEIDSAAASLKLQLLGWKHDLLDMEHHPLSAVSQQVKLRSATR
jgi:hypothetical protein